MTYLGDSIIGRNVSFGGGCMTGNLRLDEQEISSATSTAKPIGTGRTKLGLIVGDHCRFGIQVGTNPGVKVGAGCFISGGAYLMEDVPQQSYVSVKSGTTHVRPNSAAAPDMHTREGYRKNV